MKNTHWRFGLGCQSPKYPIGTLRKAYAAAGFRRRYVNGWGGRHKVGWLKLQGDVLLKMRIAFGVREQSDIDEACRHNASPCGRVTGPIETHTRILRPARLLCNGRINAGGSTSAGSTVRFPSLRMSARGRTGTIDARAGLRRSG